MPLRCNGLGIVFTLIALAVTTPLAAQAPAADSGAFVIRLGRDTVKVERYVLRDGWIISESVRRGTTIETQRVEVRLNADGTIDHMVARMHPWPPHPMAQPIGGSLVYARGDSTILEIGLPPKPARVVYPGRTHLANNGVNPFVFALYVSTAAYAPTRGGDSLVSRHMASTLDHRPLVIRRVAPDLVVTHSQVMGTMKIHLGPDGRVREIDGVGSSLNYNAERIGWVDLDSVARAFDTMNRARGGVAAVSPRDSVVARLRGATVKIDYGRPSKRGRVVFGGIVPHGRVWRAGANLATHLTTDRPLEFGGTVLPAGRYTLFVLPTEKHWTLLINQQTGQWGTDYDATHDVARVPMLLRVLDAPVEQFAIVIDDDRAGGVLRLRWDATEASVPFTVR